VQNNSGSSLSEVVNGELSLIYETDLNGSRIPDYSYAGYKGGGVPLPSDVDVAPVFILPLGSTTADLQNLINTVSNEPVNVTTGYRGIIQFEQGVYNLTDSRVNIGKPGILFRGVGSDHNGTVLLMPTDTLFQVLNSHAPTRVSPFMSITKFVPTSSHRLYLANTSYFSVGDLVEVLLNIDNDWKASVQTTLADSLPSTYSVTRYVVTVTADYVEVEAPIYYSMFSGGVAVLTDYTMRNLGWAHFRVIRPEGNPNLGLVLEFHATVIDFFIKDVVSEFVGTIWQGGGRRFTAEDCVALFNPLVTGFDPDIRQMFRIYSVSEMFIHRCHQSYGRSFLSSNTVFGSSGIVVSHCSDLRTWRGYYIFGAWFPGQLVDHVYTEYGLSWGADGLGSHTGISSVIWNTYSKFETGGYGVLDCNSPTDYMTNLCVGATTSTPDGWK